VFIESPSLDRLCAFDVVRLAVGANYCKLTGCNQPKKSQTDGPRRQAVSGIAPYVASLRHWDRAFRSEGAANLANELD
jgi:hypothetical protein